MRALAEAIPVGPQAEEAAPNRAANDNQPANPTIVDLPAPSPEQVDGVLDTLADVLVARAIRELGIGPADGGPPGWS